METLRIPEYATLHHSSGDPSVKFYPPEPFPPQISQHLQEIPNGTAVEVLAKRAGFVLIDHAGNQGIVREAHVQIEVHAKTMAPVELAKGTQPEGRRLLRSTNMVDSCQAAATLPEHATLHHSSGDPFVKFYPPEPFPPQIGQHLQEIPNGTAVGVLAKRAGFVLIDHAGNQGMVRETHVRTDVHTKVTASVECAKGTHPEGHMLLGWSSVVDSWQVAAPLEDPFGKGTIVGKRSLTSSDPSIASVVCKLKVMTQNVWFDNKDKMQRFHGLMDLIEREAPDMVALQEMTPEAVGWLMSHRFIRERYWMTNPAIVTVKNWYGLLTLVSQELSSASHRIFAAYYDYGELSTLGRGLLVVTFEVQVGVGRVATIAVGNTHLESPVQGILPKHRFKQLQQASRTLAGLAKHYICMGDFNFTSEMETDGLRPCCFKDCWLVSKPGDTTGTHRGKGTRPDRVACSLIAWNLHQFI